MNDGPRRLAISFSGGETSGYMLKLLWDARAEWDEVVVTFANTGQEWEKTLIFVKACADHWGIPVVWLEGEAVHGERVAARHRVVSFETAARKGEPFEDMVSKYGVPNPTFKHCTRTTKLNPMTRYLRSIGWAAGSYETAIGIRWDEPARIGTAPGLFYPLFSRWPTTKPEVNEFWASMPFRLGLKGYQGNCKTCYKKSDRKLFTIARETPEAFEFFARMEAKYGLVGPEIERGSLGGEPLRPGYRRVFFRGSRSVGQMLVAAATTPFEPAPDDATVYPVRFNAALDTGGACDGGEACEIFSDDEGD